MEGMGINGWMLLPRARAGWRAMDVMQGEVGTGMNRRPTRLRASWESVSSILEPFEPGEQRWKLLVHMYPPNRVGTYSQTHSVHVYILTYVSCTYIVCIHGSSSSSC